MSDNEEREEYENWYADGMVNMGRCIFALGAGAVAVACFLLYSAALQ